MTLAVILVVALTFVAAVITPEMCNSRDGTKGD